jgi:hypothetical protein
MKKRYLFSMVLAIFLLLSFVGCDEMAEALSGASEANQPVALADAAEAKQPANHDRQISGLVVDVQYIAEGSSFNAPDIVKTIVTFEDGRVKAFNGISTEIFQKGVTNVIDYNRSDNIISVKIE